MATSKWFPSSMLLLTGNAAQKTSTRIAAKSASASTIRVSDRRLGAVPAVGAAESAAADILRFCARRPAAVDDRAASELGQHQVHFVGLLLGHLVLFVNRLQSPEELDEVVFGKADDVMADDRPHEPANRDEIIQHAKIPPLVVPQPAAKSVGDSRR